MKKINRGKDWEKTIFDTLSQRMDVTRIPDQMSMMKTTSQNYCDMIAYEYPHIAYVECKSVYGDRFDFTNITDNQRTGLLKRCEIVGAFAGVVVWFIDHDVVMVMRMDAVDKFMTLGKTKSINIVKYLKGNYRNGTHGVYTMRGTKKRVLIDVDVNELMSIMEVKL